MMGGESKFQVLVDDGWASTFCCRHIQDEVGPWQTCILTRLPVVRPNWEPSRSSSSIAGPGVARFDMDIEGRGSVLLVWEGVALGRVILSQYLGRSSIWVEETHRKQWC